MRMVVVLPLPLGPRKPQMRPRATCSVDVVDDGAAVVALGQPAHVDGQPVRHRGLDAAARRTSIGWPGLQPAASSAASRPRLDHEHQLARAARWSR